MTKPILLAAEPQLFVSSIEASCEFYTQRLGFKVAFIFGKPPFYAQVFRDGASLNLRHLKESPFRPELREELLSASITLEDSEPLFLEFQAAGVTFAQPLKSEPWGAMTFIVSDPDGNLILFAGRVGPDRNPRKEISEYFAGNEHVKRIKLGNNPAKLASHC